MKNGRFSDTQIMAVLK
jgi:putative transposase